MIMFFLHFTVWVVQLMAPTLHHVRLAVTVQTFRSKTGDSLCPPELQSQSDELIHSSVLFVVVRHKFVFFSFCFEMTNAGVILRQIST